MTKIVIYIAILWLTYCAGYAMPDEWYVSKACSDDLRERMEDKAILKACGDFSKEPGDECIRVWNIIMADRDRLFLKRQSEKDAAERAAKRAPYARDMGIGDYRTFIGTDDYHTYTPKYAQKESNATLDCSSTNVSSRSWVENYHCGALKFRDAHYSLFAAIIEMRSAVDIMFGVNSPHCRVIDEINFAAIYLFYAALSIPVIMIKLAVTCVVLVGTLVVDLLFLVISQGPWVLTFLFFLMWTMLKEFLRIVFMACCLHFFCLVVACSFGSSSHCGRPDCTLCNLMRRIKTACNFYVTQVSVEVCSLRARLCTALGNLVFACFMKMPGMKEKIAENSGAIATPVSAIKKEESNEDDDALF
jgi:hypothetical protein